MRKLLFTLCLLLVLLAACAEKELNVSYVHIPEVLVAQAPASGTITEAITAVRVVIGPKTLGFYPLPATIPILETGETTIRLEPSVQLAGLSSEYLVYPMYEAQELVLDLRANQTDTLRPAFAYLPNVEFALVEDFNSSGTVFIENLDEFPETSMAVVNDSLRPGNRVGRVTLTDLASIYEGATSALVPLQNPIELWAEIDFRGSASLSLGILPEATGTPADRGFRYTQGTLPRDGWQKFYFNLRNQFTEAENLDAGPFRLGIVSATDTAGTTREFFIDNLKVLYR